MRTTLGQAPKYNDQIAWLTASEKNGSRRVSKKASDTPSTTVEMHAQKSHRCQNPNLSAPTSRR